MQNLVKSSHTQWSMMSKSITLKLWKIFGSENQLIVHFSFSSFNFWPYLGIIISVQSLFNCFGFNPGLIRCKKKRPVMAQSHLAVSLYSKYDFLKSFTKSLISPKIFLKLFFYVSFFGGFDDNECVNERLQQQQRQRWWQ